MPTPTQATSAASSGNVVQPGQTQKQAPPSRKGLTMFLGGLFVVILALVGFTVGLVKFGYLHPNAERCNTELSYHWLQSRTMEAKTFKLPFSETTRAWLWEEGARIAGPDGNIAPDSPLMWLGACKGTPAPRNENIRVSFDGLGMLLLVWITTTIAFGFNKRRVIGLVVLTVLGMLLVPHWTTARLGDWAAWIRYGGFWLLGLSYFFVSWKLLNKKAGVVTVTPVAVK